MQTMIDSEAGTISKEVSVEDRKLAREAEIEVLRVMAQKLEQLSISERVTERRVLTWRQNQSLTTISGLSHPTATSEVSKEGSSATASQKTAPVLTTHMDKGTTADKEDSERYSWSPEEINRINAELRERLGYDALLLPDGTVSDGEMLSP
jgi:hypothetical protein